MILNRTYWIKNTVLDMQIHVKVSLFLYHREYFESIIILTQFLFKFSVCKYLSVELQERFKKLGDTSEVIETGYQIDGPKKRVEYTKSELYYIEALEGVCDKLLEYNIHKERKDSNRFAKGRSMTFNTLHKLADKGVKVELGIPRELWDTPSAEITALKQQCEDYVEKYDHIIEQWYWGNRTQELQQYLCRERVLNDDQKSCLDDPPAPVTPVEDSSESSVESPTHSYPTGDEL